MVHSAAVVFEKVVNLRVVQSSMGCGLVKLIEQLLVLDLVPVGITAGCVLVNRQIT